MEPPPVTPLYLCRSSLSLQSAHPKPRPDESPLPASSSTSPSSAAAPSVYHHLLLLLARRLQHSRGLRSVLSAHTRVLKSGLSRHATTANHLINAYVRHRDAAHAEHAFEDMSGSANVVSWTSVMASSPFCAACLREPCGQTCLLSARPSMCVH